MSPVLDADFSKISTDFEPVPADVYRSKIVKIESVETKENKLPALNIELEIMAGDFAGRKLFDFVTLKQKDGKRNDVGYGRIKAYAIAILGEEAANSGAIDTDALVGGSCDCVVEVEKYAKKAEKGGGEGTRNKVAKILPAQ